FVFDSCSLLNLYGYRNQGREAVFDILEENKSDLWFPSLVLIEFNNKRESIIIQRLEKYKAAIEKIRKKRNSVKGIVHGTYYGNEPLFENQEELFTQLRGITDTITEELDKVIEALPFKKTEEGIIEDGLIARLSTFFENRTGPRPKTQLELDEIYSDGERRYSYEIPPGFCDNKEKKGTGFLNRGLLYDCRFSDLVIWKQMIEKAKSKKIENVIFITDDEKEDWFLKDGDDLLGPRPELVKEIRYHSGIDNFLMYTIAGFLSGAKKHLGAEILDETIDQITLAEMQKEEERKLSPSRLTGRDRSYMLSGGKAFYEWLKSRYPISNIEIDSNIDGLMLDFVVASYETPRSLPTIVGFDLKFYGRLVPIPVLNKKWFIGDRAVLVGELTSFYLVIITRTEDLAVTFINDLSENSDRLHPQFKYIVGYIRQEHGEQPRFVDLLEHP
ncbi:MAG: hypothetical protein GY771_17060, partial [bacterium]|nr:hypothetical protein [bacterium]